MNVGLIHEADRFCKIACKRPQRVSAAHPGWAYDV